MKWLVFTGAIVVALISLGVLAVDERDAVWEGRKALCPYCRSDLKMYALACRDCDRTIDWVSRSESCRWCLSEEDVAILRDGFDALALGPDDPLPASVAEFTRAYLLSIEPGKCTYCGGLGQVWSGESENPCPVCRGEKQCIACGGDGTVVVGDKEAHKRAFERTEIWEEALRREALTHLKLRRAQLVNDDVEVLSGFAEAEKLVDEKGQSLLVQARQRIARAFKAIHDAVEQKQPAVD
jgi:hypothetical protein